MSRMAAGTEFEEIAWLRANSPAWRLLRADSAPLVLSFLHRVFVEENVRSIPAAELASRLDDELYARNERVRTVSPSPRRRTSTTGRPPSRDGCASITQRAATSRTLTRPRR